MRYATLGDGSDLLGESELTSIAQRWRAGRKGLPPHAQADRRCDAAQRGHLDRWVAVLDSALRRRRYACPPRRSPTGEREVGTRQQHFAAETLAQVARHSRGIKSIESS